MEPFQLTLNQVNFEEKDLSPNQTLHSFSNLVNYDSDFKDDDNEHGNGLPITTKQFSDTKASRDPASFLQDEREFLAEKRSQYSNNYHTISVVQANKRSLPMDKSTAFEPSKDSFKAFTDTVEALALQKSVIGGSNIKPASAEEIAKAIAEAQAKIAGGQKKMAVGSDYSGASMSMTDDADSSHDTESPHETAGSDASGMTDDVDFLSLAQMDSFGIVPADPLTSPFAGASLEVRSKSQKVTAVKSSITISQRDIDGQDVQRKSEYEALQASQDVRRVGVHKSKGKGQGGPSVTKVNASKKMSLIRIKPQEVVKVTERGSKGKVVPSEKIKPANFPTNALSLIMPQEPGSEENAIDNDESVAMMHQQYFQIKDQSGMIQEHIVRAEGGLQVDVSDLKMIGKGNAPYSRESKSYAKTSHTSDRKEPANVYSDNIPDMAALAEKIGSLENRNVSSNTASITTSESSISDSEFTDGKIDYKFNGQADHHAQDASSVSTRTKIKNVHTLQTQNTVNVKVLRSVEEELRDEDVFNFMAAADAITDSANDYEEVSEENEMPQIQPVELPQRPKQRYHYSIDKPDLTVPEFKKADFKLPDIDPSSLKLQFSEYSQPKEIVNQKSDNLINDATYENLREELTRVLKENAKLEGQLEMLGLEARIAIKERAELQAQVAGMKSHLQAQTRSATSAVSDRDTLEKELQTLRQNHSHLEKVVINAQRVIESKDADNKALQEELQLVNDQKDDFQEKIVSVKKELAAQESKVVDFKNKITELYVEYQMSNQSRILAENEMKSLQSEIKSLQSSQNWYQEQLKHLQDGKREMQETIAGFQTKNIESMTLIERLKAESVRIKQQLTDAQQKALNEKNVLAHHLEVIEADMIEREAAFAQLQQQRLSLEQLVNNEEAKAKQIDDMTSLMELQEELSKLKNENRRRKAQVSVLEHEQTELVKRLTLSQESILERDKTIDDFDKKFVELKIQCQAFENDLNNKNNEVSRLSNLNSTLEDDLKSAKEEKVEFDQALSTLKQDMIKVEFNFKKMKNDLAQKEIELNKALGDKKSSEQNVETLQSEIAMLTARQQQHLAQLTSEIERHQAENEKLQQSALPPQEDLSRKCEQLEEEKSSLATNLNSALEENRNLQQQWQEMQTKLLQTTSEISATSDKCGLFEKQLLQSQQENAQLQCQVTELQSTSEEVMRFRDEFNKLHTQLSRVVEENHAYKQKSEYLENYVTHQQETQKQLEERVNAYTVHVKELEVLKSNAETGMKTAVENLQQKSDVDSKAESQYITSLEEEVKNLKTQCNDWQMQLKSSVQKLEEYDLLKVKVKSLEELVQNSSARQETKTANASTQQEQENTDKEFVTLDAHIDEVNALRLEIQSLNDQFEEMEGMKEKLKFLEGEQFTVDAVSDELEEAKMRMEDMQMEIDEWKKVVEVMQNSGVGDEDSEKDSVKVDLALQQMKKLHDMEMEEVQQKLAEKEEMLEGLQKSGGKAARLWMEDDEDEDGDGPEDAESREEPLQMKKLSQDDLLKLIGHQMLTVEQMHVLVTSLGFTISQLLQLSTPSNLTETLLREVISGGKVSTESVLQVICNLELTHEQLLAFIKSRDLPQEELLKIVDFSKMDPEQIIVLNKDMLKLLNETQLVTFLHSLSLPAEQLLSLAHDKGLTEEDTMKLILNVKWSDERLISLVQKQDLPLESMIKLVHSFNMPTENFIPLLQSQPLSEEQLTSFLHSQNVSEELVVDLVKSKGPTNESKELMQKKDEPKEQVATAETPKQQEVPQQGTKQKETKRKDAAPTWEQIRSVVQSPNVSQDQLLQTMMAMNVSKEVLFAFMQTTVSEELLFALVHSQGLSQDHLMLLIQHYGLSPEHFVTLLHTQQVPLPNIVALLQSQNLSPEQLSFLVHQSGMTEEQMIEFVKAWNLPSEKLISLAQSNGISLEVMLSLVQSQNLSQDQLAAFVHSLNLSAEIEFSLVQATGLTQEQLKWFIQHAQQKLPQEQLLEALKSLTLTFEQLQALLLNSNITDDQRLQLAQSMNLSADTVLSLVQSKGLSQEQLMNLFKQQISPQKMLSYVAALHTEQLLVLVQNMSDEERLEFGHSLDLVQQNLNPMLKQSPQQINENPNQFTTRDHTALVNSGQPTKEEPAMVHAPNVVKEQLKNFVKSKNLSVEDRAEALVQDLSEEQLIHLVREMRMSTEHLLSLVQINELPAERIYAIVQSWLPQERLVEVVKAVQLPQEVMVPLLREQIPQEQLLEAVHSREMNETQVIHLIESLRISKEKIVELLQTEIAADSVKVSSPEEYLKTLQGNPLSAEQILTLVHSNEVAKDLLSVLIPCQKLSREDFEQFAIYESNDQVKKMPPRMQNQEKKPEISRDDAIMEMIESENLSVQIMTRLIEKLHETQKTTSRTEIWKILEKTKLEETQLISILRAQEWSQEQLMNIVRSLNVSVQNVQQVPGQDVTHPHGQLEGHLTVQSEGLSDERLSEFLEAYKLSQGQLMSIIRSQLSQEGLMHMLDNLSLEESQKIANADTGLQLQASGCDEEGNVGRASTTETTKHLTFALSTLEQLETELKTMENLDMSQPLSDHWNKISNWITLTIKCVIEVKNVYKYYIEEKQLPIDFDPRKAADMMRMYEEENKILKERIQQVSNLQHLQIHDTKKSTVNSEDGDISVAEILAEVADLRKQLEQSRTENDKLQSFQLNVSRAVGLEIEGSSSSNIDLSHNTALSQLLRYIEQLQQQSSLMEEQITGLLAAVNDAQEGSEEQALIEAQMQELRHMSHLTQAAKIKLEAAITSVQDTCCLPQVKQLSISQSKTDTTEVNELIRDKTNESPNSSHLSTQDGSPAYTPESETDSEKEIRHLREQLKESKLRVTQLETQLKQVREYITNYFSHAVSATSDSTSENKDVSASLDGKVQLETSTQTEASESFTKSEGASVVQEGLATSEQNERASGDGAFKYYDKGSNSFDKGITHLIQSLEITNEIKQFLHKELSVIIYENHQVKKSVYDEQMNQILQKLLTATNEVSRLKGVIKQKESAEQNSGLLQQQMKLMEEELADLGEQKSQLELILQEANKSIREMSEQLLSAQKTHNSHVEKTTEAINQWQQACNLRDQQLQLFHNQILELQKEVETHKAEKDQQKLEMTQTKNLALELEKERGRLAGVMQSYNALKDHAATLEAALAQQESSVTDLSSTNREELEKRNRLITQLEEKINELEDSVQSEKGSNKDLKKQLMTEKGAHIKSKRLAESVQQNQKQNKADLDLAQEELARTVALLEESRDKERSVGASLEDAKGKIQALQTELDRLKRELSDKRGKDPIMQERIKTLEWEVSQRVAELEATQNRVQLIEDRKQMELVNMQKALQTTINDVKIVRDELSTVKQEKIALQAKVAELRASVEVTNVQNKVFQFQKKESATKEEITSAGASVASSSDSQKGRSSVRIESKPLSFLQETLNSLRGEISNLQLQVDEHTCAVQSSSQAWKDLEVQVKDLRELCKTSADDRSNKTTVKKREPPPMVHLPMLSPSE